MKATVVAGVESPVIAIRNAAGTAKINLHELQGNVSVLESRDEVVAARPTANYDAKWVASRSTVIFSPN
jgi:hypothetical protein